MQGKKVEIVVVSSKKTTRMMSSSSWDLKKFKKCRPVLLIQQSFHKVKLHFSSCFFSKPDSSEAKIIRKLVAFAIL